MKTKGPVVAALTAILLSTLAAADGWTKISGSFFSVEMPGKPEKKEAQQEIPGVGMTKTTYFELQLPDLQFTVGTTEFPREMIEKSIPSKMLEGSRDGSLANIGATLTSDSVVFIDSGAPNKKWPGRTFVGTHPSGLVVRQAVFLVDTFLLQLVCVGPKGKDTAPDFAKLVASLKLSAPRAPAKEPSK
jgi:hypothetical protein